MNNKNWIALFFGLACLVLLIGVFSVSGTMNNTGRNNTTTPQQINQNLMNGKPKDGTLPSEINANDIINNTASPSPSPTASPNNILAPNNTNNPNQMPKINVPNMKQ